MGDEWSTFGSGVIRRDAIKSGFDINLTFQQPPPQHIMAPRSTKQSGLASLACTECRKQHLKCDAKKPTCSRCLQNAYFCQYLPSRRGGHRKPRNGNESTRRSTYRPPEQIDVSPHPESYIVDINTVIPSGLPCSSSSDSRSA